MKRQLPLLGLALLLFSAGAHAQTNGVSINEAGSPPDPSAIFDVSSTTKGALIPRMTKAERDEIANPALGLQIFNTTTNCLNIWTGDAWRQVCGDCDFPSPVASNDGPVCEGEDIQLSATTIPGATYQWSGPNGFTSTQQNPNLVNPGPQASGTYYVVATLNACSSVAQPTLVLVKPIPSAPETGQNGPLCVGNTLNLTASEIAGASYSWTGPNGYSGSFQNPVITDVQLSQAGQYLVQAVVEGCYSSASSVNVVVNDTPATPGSIVGETTTCANSTGNEYSISPVSGATSYNWSLPSGSSISDDQGSSVTVSFGPTSGDITVSATNECGTSSTSTLSVTLTGASGSQTFNATGSGPDGTIQSFVVPQCVTSMVIEVWGAEGGMRSSSPGGKGARMKGTFAVTAGETLQILVGQKGNDQPSWGGGGGGGTFVARGTDYTTAELMIAAGGGGGGPNGADGVSSTNGVQGGGGGAGGSGGVNGNAGQPGANGDYGGSGAGWLTNGGQGTRGGTRFQEGGAGSASGDARGGFGGGGGSWNSGAGGGGYSGGGGGGTNSPTYGGGGGSYNAGTDQSNSSGVQTGNGLVVLTW